jgi:hypothetical protein
MAVPLGDSRIASGVPEVLSGARVGVGFLRELDLFLVILCIVKDCRSNVKILILLRVRVRFDNAKVV